MKNDNTSNYEKDLINYENNNNKIIKVKEGI